MNSTEVPGNGMSQSQSLRPGRGQRAQDGLEADFKPMDSTRLFSVMDAMLKRPGQVVYDLIHGKGSGASVALLMILLVCLAGTGLVMGGFSGGSQLIAVPLKVMVGTLAAGVICLPSLYILLCLSGGRQNFMQTVRMLLLGLSLAGILLVGFIPVAWIFSQATESEIFMGMIYLAIWGIGLFFGLRLMRNAFQFLNRRGLGALGLWMLIFCMVLLQMSTTLRPLVGAYEPLQLGEKMFFLEHWVH